MYQCHLTNANLVFYSLKIFFWNTAKYSAASQYGFPLPITEFYLSDFRLFLISTILSLQLFFFLIGHHRIIEVGRRLWRTSALLFCSKHSYFWCGSGCLAPWAVKLINASTKSLWREKVFFFYSGYHLPCCSWWPLQLVLSLSVPGKSVAPFSLKPWPWPWF